ncbi:head-tail connector protein [Novosphingobium sp. NPDC080210]|uniref:head-tail connector protein n=1 Tax=Novosphingobium sp. NPDC080210 TaxID=3390596 RepID=UPI003CFC9AB7
MGISLITAPTAYPVTLDEVKAQCRVDGTADDTALNGYIAAATDYVEQYTGRAIMAQTWKLTLDAFSDSILLPKGPVQSISAVQYFNAEGVETTLLPEFYTLDASDPAWIVRNSGSAWPETLDAINAVSITYVAGYSQTPAAIKQAILLLVGDWFRSRENTALGSNQPSEMPHAVTALLANYRAFGF